MGHGTLVGSIEVALERREKPRLLPASGDRWWTAIAECWKARHLLFVLMRRDLKARYKQTLLGVAWAVLQPFLAMVVFTIIFSRFAKVSSGSVPYPVFVFCGLLPWQLFSQGLTRAGSCLVDNRLLVTRLRVSRLLLPLSAVLIGLPDFGAALVVLLAIMLYYGITPAATALLMIPLIVLVLATALALGLFLSAVNVRFRDVGYTIPFFTQLWFFITPVAYPMNLVPERWRLLYGLNPMASVVEGMRWALLGNGSKTGTTILYSAMGVLLLLVLGVRHFQSAEPTFADMV